MAGNVTGYNPSILFIPQIPLIPQIPQEIMKNEIFLKELVKYQMYLKPQLYNVLVNVGEVFTEEMRMELINELEKADLKMEKLAIYEKKREGIIKRGINTLKELYNKAKASLEKEKADDEDLDRAKAEEIIANI